MKKINIAPSLLSCDFSKLEKEILDVEKAGASYLHFDVMDGHFVKNITFGAPVLKCISKKHHMINDCHLMVTDPKDFLLDFIKAGADLITVHYETLKNNDFIEIYNILKLNNIKIGMSIKPNTQLDLLYPYLEKIDLVLVMSVEPGFGGQAFIPSSLERIKTLDNYRKEHHLNYLIEVDGGINDLTAKDVINSGADILVSGSYIFKSNNYKEAIERLK